ncbi:MAG TPA: preprotein translocase subunit SecG [Caulobacterales bacterium]|nr:preprotein translocase subunit SecG [Caulobacterales bacterium]
MTLAFLILHVVICIGLIGLVLLQRSEGGALGMGGGGSGALMSGRGAADALARMTSFAGGFFLVTSLVLTVMSGGAQSVAGRSVIDAPAQQTNPLVLPTAPPPATTTEPAGPDQSAIEPAAQLASANVPAGPTDAQAVAPPPASAATHAAPIATTPPRANASTAANTTTQRTPAPLTVRSNPPPARTTPAAATANNPPPASNRPLQGVPALTQSPEQTGSESGQTTTTTDQPVRRERAGPDQ